MQRRIFILSIILFVSGYSFSGVLKKRIPDRLIVLTFDDATASQYSNVAPLLKKFGFGATFFVCEFPPNFKDTSKYMNWRQIRELDQMGFEIANHTRNHPAVSKLTPEKFLKQLNYIERKCDSMNIARPETFAYPGYSLSLQVINVLQEKGYQFARAGGGRAYDPLTDHPLLIPSWAMNSENKVQIRNALQEAKNGKIVVLTIHGVPDVEHPWVNTPQELFEDYLKYFAENKFNVIALRDLKEYIDTKKAMKSIIPDLNKKLKN
ncbi:MAG: polysaccharide deacetylase family protein [Prolixibacteraceae bacterium]|jgi:peptidoglycan/xylan/chitin deacetylase (PgdA/CDA1 family)